MMFFQKLFNINKEVVVKVYHGYGDKDKLLLLGHVFKASPAPPEKYRNNIFWNIKALIKLFLAKPYPDVKVQLQWGEKIITSQTDENGFFRFEWQSGTPIDKGWNTVKVNALTEYGQFEGEGNILVPYTTQYVFISDIDDTFLVSHSSNIIKRLYELFTKNAQTRKTFDDVVRHYQLLAKNESGTELDNPFFYVSSSEWNLYEYIKEFCRTQRLPEGVFLLSPLKKIHELIKTGQGKHETKYDRIVQIISTFPDRKYILMGDNTQKDPSIYAKVVNIYPENIRYIYLRNVSKRNNAATIRIVKTLRERGVSVCYYKHSSEAILHSRDMELF